MGLWPQWLLLLAWLALLAEAARAASNYEPYTFTHFAGAFGGPGYSDGTGSVARFWHPSSVAVDSSGNVYVADAGNETIRKITPGGVVSTLAGLAGNSGSNDGSGSAARFWHPSSVAVDSSGNVYVADTDNSTIRKITPGGVVSTLAGLAGSTGSADGAGSAARFYYPYGVAVDSLGNLYVADSWNSTIRKITSGGVVSTLAGQAGSLGSDDGTGSDARFSDPSGLAVDSSGNVYVDDTLNNTIRKITPGGVVSTLAGLAASSGNDDGTGSAARFYYPTGIAVDSSGDVYVADSNNQYHAKGHPRRSGEHAGGAGRKLWQRRWHRQRRPVPFAFGRRGGLFWQCLCGRLCKRHHPQNDAGRSGDYAGGAGGKSWQRRRHQQRRAVQ
jgi:sugar lactone lactonase YvrE